MPRRPTPARYRRGAPRRSPDNCGGRVPFFLVIPLPRAWLLTSAMLVGAAAGVLLGVLAMLVVTAPVRPDIAIAATLGVPSVLGLAMVVFSGRRWVTMLGAFLVAVAPGWFTVLVATQVVHGA